MKRVLPRKATMNNSQCREVFVNIEEYVSRQEAQELVDRTVDDIQRVCKGKNVAFAWSGGKDSLALQVVCERAGINRSVCCVTPEFEYKCMLDFFKSHAPQDIEYKINKKLTVDWLKAHPHMLHPTDMRLISEWAVLTFRKPAQEFYFDNHLDYLINGHRAIDGNYILKDGITRNADGFVRYSPLRNWSHEEVFAVIRYFTEGTLPDLYWKEDGFLMGTSMWPFLWLHANILKKYSGLGAWRHVYEIEPDIVIRMSHHFETAQKFLNSINYGK